LWSVRWLEGVVADELKLDEVELRPKGPGRFVGAGATADGVRWTIDVTQVVDEHVLKWKAVDAAGERRTGHLELSNGVIVDMTIR
jgi:hypothetical protein